MNDPTPLPPPPSPIPPAEPEPTAAAVSELRPTRTVFAIAAGLATAIAIGIGLAVGFSVGAASASSCTPSDGWCDLGAAIMGFVAGVAGGVITYIVAGVLTIRRLRPSGHRAGLTGALLAAPLVLALALQLLSMLVDALT